MRGLNNFAKDVHSKKLKISVRRWADLQQYTAKPQIGKICARRDKHRAYIYIGITREYYPKIN